MVDVFAEYPHSTVSIYGQTYTTVQHPEYGTLVQISPRRWVSPARAAEELRPAPTPMEPIVIEGQQYEAQSIPEIGTAIKLDAKWVPLEHAREELQIRKIAAEADVPREQVAETYYKSISGHVGVTPYPVQQAQARQRYLEQQATPTEPTAPAITPPVVSIEAIAAQIPTKLLDTSNGFYEPIPAAAYEKIGMSPFGPGFDPKEAARRWKELQEQKMMAYYVKRYEERIPKKEELVSRGEALAQQHELWEKTGQLEPKLNIPEEIWGELVKTELAIKKIEEEKIIYELKEGISYEQLVSAYERAGQTPPQTIVSLAEYNRKVQQYISDVQARARLEAYKEKLTPPKDFWFELFMAPITIPAEFISGVVEFGTFGYVQLTPETPGGYELMFGAAEKLGRGGESPEWFTTVERAQRAAKVPWRTAAKAAGETFAAWGVMKLIGAGHQRAIKSATEILQKGEIVAPRATEIFYRFGEKVTYPSKALYKALHKAGERIYVGAVERVEQLTGKTLYVEARPGLPIISEMRGIQAEVGPWGAKTTKFLGDVTYIPSPIGETVRVPYLEFVRQQRAWFDMEKVAVTGASRSAWQMNVAGQKMTKIIGGVSEVAPISTTRDITVSLFGGTRVGPTVQKVILKETMKVPAGYIPSGGLATPLLAEAPQISLTPITFITPPPVFFPVEKVGLTMGKLTAAGVTNVMGLAKKISPKKLTKPLEQPKELLAPGLRYEAFLKSAIEEIAEVAPIQAPRVAQIQHERIAPLSEIMQTTKQITKQITKITPYYVPKPISPKIFLFPFPMRKNERISRIRFPIRGLEYFERRWPLGRIEKILNKGITFKEPKLDFRMPKFKEPKIDFGVARRRRRRKR